MTQALAGAPGPVIATSDYQRAVQNLIAPWVPGDYIALGADGFGFSDTRAAARRHFLIDGPSMVVATLAALERRGEYREGAAAEAAAQVPAARRPGRHVRQRRRRVLSRLGRQPRISADDGGPRRARRRNMPPHPNPHAARSSRQPLRAGTVAELEHASAADMPRKP